LNTGGVGERREEGKNGNKILKQAVLRVEIPEMAAIIRGDSSKRRRMGARSLFRHDGAKKS